MHARSLKTTTVRANFSIACLAARPKSRNYLWLQLVGSTGGVGIVPALQPNLHTT
jgi:hypothetical protein